jgi:transcriptional regulator with XRE-family HTH domain
METIGNRLEYVRRQKGLTYGQLADYVGITGDAIRIAVKRDKVKDYYVNVFSEQLGINRNWLISGEGDMVGNSPIEMTSVKNYLGSHENDYNPKEVAESSFIGIKELAEARLRIIELLTAENARLKIELAEIKEFR